MRILTIGAKLPINWELATRKEFDVWASSADPTPADSAAPYRTWHYQQNFKLSVASVSQVRDAIRHVKPDMVHAFYPRPLAHAVLAALSLRWPGPIVSYRGITSLPSRWNLDQWITYLSPRVAAHACESEAVRASLLGAGIPTERCHVVHNCLTTPPAPPERLEARRALGLSPDDFVVMMVANMRPVKGADLLLRAAGSCLDIENLKVVLIGHVLDARVERLARAPHLEGLVQMCGYRPDASKLFAAADVFVMPSRAEALCMALIEAMTAGICPIVSDAGGMKEAVRSNVDGLVFPTGNVAALAATIRYIHANPQLAATFGESARRRALDHFSATAMVDRLAAMYQSLSVAA